MERFSRNRADMLRFYHQAVSEALDAMVSAAIRAGTQRPACFGF